MIDARLREAPFLSLTAAAGRVEARGPSACRLGQPLDQAGTRPDGVFAEWGWDGSRLLARNDRHGLHPLFYAVDGATIALSPSIPRLLLEGAPPELDEPALAVFIRTGYFVGEDTPFRAIRALPPRATLEWSAGRLRIAGGLRPPAPRELSRDEAIDAYIPLFRAAVRRRLPPGWERERAVGGPADRAAGPGTAPGSAPETVRDLVMPLSGGRDSRHILFELATLGCRPGLCLTVRHHLPRTDQDAEIAPRVAAALGLPHVLLDQTEPRLQAEQRKNLLTSFCSDEGTAFLALGDYLERQWAGRSVTIFDGLGGDFLSDGRFLSEQRLALLEAGRLADLADDLLSGRPHLPSLLSAELAPRLSRAVAIERLEAELARHLDAPNPITSYIFFNRCRREIASFAFNFYGPGVEKLCPYVDHELAEFLLSLPARVFLPPSFHADTIERAFPEHAAIPFEHLTHRFDERYRQELAGLFAEIDGSLERAPSRLLDTEQVRARMADFARSGRAPGLFSVHLIYALQLERFVAELPAR
jgi:hypothetical protein